MQIVAYNDLMPNTFAALTPITPAAVEVWLWQACMPIRPRLGCIIGQIGAETRYKVQYKLPGTRTWGHVTAVSVQDLRRSVCVQHLNISCSQRLTTHEPTATVDRCLAA